MEVVHAAEKLVTKSGVPVTTVAEPDVAMYNGLPENEPKKTYTIVMSQHTVQPQSSVSQHILPKYPILSRLHKTGFDRKKC